MSIARAAYVTCDECGAPGPVDCFDGARGARAAARERGFCRVRVTPGGSLKDLCFNCARRLGV